MTVINGSIAEDLYPVAIYVYLGWEEWEKIMVRLRWLDPVFLRGYHPTLKLSGIPTFTFIVSLTHRMGNI